MVKIPLNDPVWTRLYGPYGVRNVPGILESLKTHWDDDLARELFWEELHHQDDIYPATYAALPWLLDIFQGRSSMPKEALIFFSVVLRCAVAPHGTGCDGKGPKGKYRGLAQHISDHAHSWLPVDQRLTEKDMASLKQLESWFEKAAPCIAEICLSAIESADDGEDVALAEGAIALAGGENLAWATEMWADGLALPDIVAQSGANSGDAQIAGKLADRIEAKSSNLSGFLRQFAEFLTTRN